MSTARDPRIEPQAGDVVIFPPKGTFGGRHPYGEYKVISRYLRTVDYFGAPLHCPYHIVVWRTSRGAKRTEHIKHWRALCARFRASLPGMEPQEEPQPAPPAFAPADAIMRIFGCADPGPFPPDSWGGLAIELANTGTMTEEDAERLRAHRARMLATIKHKATGETPCL